MHRTKFKKDNARKALARFFENVVNHGTVYGKVPFLEVLLEQAIELGMNNSHLIDKCFYYQIDKLDDLGKYSLYQYSIRLETEYISHSGFIFKECADAETIAKEVVSILENYSDD